MAPGAQGQGHGGAQESARLLIQVVPHQGKDLAIVRPFRAIPAKGLHRIRSLAQILRAERSTAGRDCPATSYVRCLKFHGALGAPLARMEAQIAFGRLLERFPHLRLEVAPEGLTYNRSSLRSLVSLPVCF